MNNNNSNPQGTNQSGQPRLTELACMRFVGTDCLTYMQGYFTRDTTTLPTGEAVPTAICNLQGRVVANGWTAQQNSDLLFFTHVSLVTQVSDFLQRYLAFSKTKIFSKSEDQQIVFAQPNKRIDGQPSPNVNNLSRLSIDGIFTINDTELLGIANDRTSEQLKSKLDEYSLALQSTAAWQHWCVEQRHALVTATTAEKFLPQMLGLQHLGGVDFSKGCYLGQEIVARAQHRGQVKKSITLLYGQLDTAALTALNVGDEIHTKAGKAVGTLVSILVSPIASKRAKSLSENQHSAPDENGQPDVLGTGCCLAVMPANTDSDSWLCNQVVLTSHPTL